METNEKSTESKVTSGCVKLDNGKKGLKIKVIRHPKDGLKLAIQSNIDLDIFKRGDGRLIKICGVPCSMAREEHYDGLAGRFYNDNIWDLDGASIPNLSMLLAENIREGVVFNMGVFPISEEKITTYISNLKQSFKVLYLSFLKEINEEVEISIATVDREKHY